MGRQEEFLRFIFHDFFQEIYNCQRSLMTVKNLWWKTLPPQCLPQRLKSTRKNKFENFQILSGKSIQLREQKPSKLSDQRQFNTPQMNMSDTIQKLWKWLKPRGNGILLTCNRSSHQRSPHFLFGKIWRLNLNRRETRFWHKGSESGIGTRVTKARTHAAGHLRMHLIVQRIKAR